MNKLSDLQTIIKVSNICNKNGLTKEADQLLNIFTKLAQEKNETEETGKLTDETSTEKEPEVLPEATTPEIDLVDEKLNEQLNNYITSLDQLMQQFTGNTSFEQNKQTLPEVNNLIDLSRTILNNPNLDTENKRVLTESLPELLKIQEVLKK